MNTDKTDNGKDKDGFENVEGNAARRTIHSLASQASKKREKNAHLPGLEPKTVPSVHRAIEQYVEARDARMGLTRVEVEKKAKMMEVMKAAGLTTYNVDGHEATLDVEETIKARLRTGEEDESDGEPRELRAPKERKGRGAGARA